MRRPLATWFALVSSAVPSFAAEPVTVTQLLSTWTTPSGRAIVESIQNRGVLIGSG